MKKWLNDLYAILLKRGLPTFDNSLKNYETLDMKISKNVKSGLINSNESVTYDLNEFNSKINDIILVKVVFSDARILIVPFMRFAESGYTRLTAWGQSGLVSLSYSGSVITILNSTTNNLNYILYINTI